jgi:hypothetical protein
MALLAASVVSPKVAGIMGYALSVDGGFMIAL